jgi:hypothetical protein
MEHDQDKTKTEEAPFEWPPLESNPDVFNEYMWSVGMPNTWCIQ